MDARSLLLGWTWLAVSFCRTQEVAAPVPPPAISAERLDEGLLDDGLLDPGWFGPGPVWSRNWRVDYFWTRPDVRMAPAALYLQPWDEPRFLSTRDALDYASGWQAAEYLQRLLRVRLKGATGLRLAASPDQTPYHAMGRIVEATHIRQGAGATIGFAAGLPTFTWDLKVVDVRTGELLLASHHRSVWGPASTWITALEAPLRTMAGLPPAPPWKEPPDAQRQEDGSWTWVAPGLRLRPGCLEAGNWTADTDTGGWWKLWTNGMGSGMAAGIQAYLRERVARSPLTGAPGTEPTHLLSGWLFSTPKYLKLRYRAVLTEVATGRVVARHEIRSPIGMPNRVWTEVSERLVAHLETLQEGVPPPPGPGAEPSPADGSQPPPGSGPAGAPGTGPDGPGPGSPTTEPAPVWEGLDRLVQVGGAVDRAWVSPALRLAGRALLVADWSAPTLRPAADGFDRQVARAISLWAPAWLYGALAAHPERGFRIHRQEGDLRLEGRVVHLYQPDRSKFWTTMGQAYTLGLSTKSEGVLQLRLVDIPTGSTLALVEQRLVSFQVASDGVPYKAFKWLAQDLVQWLLREGRREVPKAAPPGDAPGNPAPPKEVQSQDSPAG